VAHATTKLAGLNLQVFTWKRECAGFAH